MLARLVLAERYTKVITAAIALAGCGRRWTGPMFAFLLPPRGPNKHSPNLPHAHPCAATIPALLVPTCSSDHMFRCRRRTEHRQDIFY